MKEFYFTQPNKAKLPYIIGTTASPIIENKKKDIDTVLSLIKLVANLDANYIEYD